jgi:HK97 family phage prohead protease
MDDTRFLEAVIEKDASGGLVAIASTNSVDRMGEVIDNNGWDLKAYKKNPIILWAHDHTEPAIGVSSRTWVEGKGKQAKLMIKPVLHDVTERAKAVKQLVEMGVIKTLSVGYKNLESPDGINLTKNELLENSFCNVPANADAMITAYKSLKSAGFENKTIQEVGIQTEVIDKLIAMEKDIEELQSTVKALPVNPSEKITRQRLSMNKVIARAADKILEADKKKVSVNKIQLVKVIKKANELLTVEEKDKL